jgi:hypothetical protein
MSEVQESEAHDGGCCVVGFIGDCEAYPADGPCKQDTTAQGEEEGGGYEFAKLDSPASESTASDVQRTMFSPPEQSRGSVLFGSAESSAFHKPVKMSAQQGAELPYLSQESGFLDFIGLYEEVFDASAEIPQGTIRVWRDPEEHYHYDCTCGKRKPIRNLKAIQHHVQRHALSMTKSARYACDKCERVFNHYLGLNSHQRTHKN